MNNYQYIVFNYDRKIFFKDSANDKYIFFKSCTEIKQDQTSLHFDYIKKFIQDCVRL